jgi:hypothetical protein
MTMRCLLKEIGGRTGQSSWEGFRAFGVELNSGLNPPTYAEITASLESFSTYYKTSPSDLHRIDVFGLEVKLPFLEFTSRNEITLSLS